ncbi:unnamed protein product [Cutaneotrichosporon oleaginosum]
MPAQKLTNPQPSLALRLIMSAAFAVCAFGVAPFVLIGLLLVAAGQPLMSAMRWWNAPRPRAKPAADVPPPPPRRRSPAYAPSEAQQLAAALRK